MDRCDTNPRHDDGCAEQPVDVSLLDQSRIFDFDLLDPRLKSNPLPIFAEWLRRERFYAIVDGIPSAVVACYEDVLAVFSDHSRFSSEKPRLPGWERIDYFNGGVNIAFSDPPVHTVTCSTCFYSLDTGNVGAYDLG